MRDESRTVAIHIRHGNMYWCSYQYWRGGRHVRSVESLRRLSLFCFSSPSHCSYQRLLSSASAHGGLRSAEQLLGLNDNSKYTARELRDAYFNAAKRCHPDSSHESKTDSNISSLDATQRFLAVTEAYELCATVARGGDAAWPEAEESFVTKTEEEEFREACKEWLGLPAETVEESKRCPLFRDWLSGGTDAACHWGNFLFLHGGLVPKLRPPAALIEEGERRSGPNRRKRAR